MWHEIRNVDVHVGQYKSSKQIMKSLNRWGVACPSGVHVTED